MSTKQRWLVPAGAVLLLLTLGTGNEPLPPPYHQFDVSGTIIRPGSGDPAGFTVVLFGHADQAFGAGNEYMMLRGAGRTRTPDRPIAITDTLGGFTIIASSDVPLDSVRFGTFIPDSPVFLGPPISVGAFYRTEHTEEYTPQSRMDCSGCVSEPASERVVVYYSYSLHGLTFDIPW